MVADLSKYNIIVIIPAYRVERELNAVLKSIPPYIRSIVVVNDASPDGTAQVIEAARLLDKRIVPVVHAKNSGVGGAMISGYQKALELGAQIVVKLDGDGQMSSDDIPVLVAPLIAGQADFTKGNRFRDFLALSRMPFIRRVGNVVLSFLAKSATGYWNCFDPTNGFLAMRGEVLAQLPLERIHKSYFFEISQLSQLYLVGACLRDVPIQARYADEISSLSIIKVLAEFPPALMALFLRRILLHYFLYDFSIGSVYILVGLPLFIFGLIFGSLEWVHYASRAIPAPTGTVMLATLTVILGIQFLLSAVSIDLQSVPREPLSRPLE
ncbi:MAG: glycosyltransferase family 2 protein [Chloroflexi bacterium]|nr:glycosyltransferase family 2 protein [Chloroflexota bacterium]